MLCRLRKACHLPGECKCTKFALNEVAATPSACSFQFERDTFAFANELVWEYRRDPATGYVTTFRNDPAPTYAHRCFVMVCSARKLFLNYGPFLKPALAATDERTYRRLIRGVVSRSPRRPSVDADKLVIPGYDGLRSFSRAQAALLKAECGDAWQSYVLRSHRRMILPISRRHQENMAAQLTRSLPGCDGRSSRISSVFRN